MLTAKHEDIVDDIREILNIAYVKDPSPYKINLATDGMFGNALMGFVDKGNHRTPRADFYIFPDDGGGPIVVEIGVNSRKWEGVMFTDGQQIRILYVSYERAFVLKHGVGTAFESDMLEKLQKLPSM